MSRAALALLPLLAAGCVGKPAFHCTASEQCVNGGDQGVCEPSGFCSFADPACKSWAQPQSVFLDPARRSVAGPVLLESLLRRA